MLKEDVNLEQGLRLTAEDIVDQENLIIQNTAIDPALSAKIEAESITK